MKIKEPKQTNLTGLYYFKTKQKNLKKSTIIQCMINFTYCLWVKIKGILDLLAFLC